MSGVCLTHPVLFPVGTFTDTLVLCDQKADKPMEEQGVLGEVCVYCASDLASVSFHQNDMANEP